MKLSSIFDLPKTIYFNLKNFDLKTAVKLPVYVHHRTKFLCLRGKVNIAGPVSRGMVRIGYAKVTIFDLNSPTIIENYGEIEFRGTASIGHGCSISVAKGGKLTIGDNFTVSSSSSIICHNTVEFGRNNLLSWQIIVMDTDFHNYMVGGVLQAWNGTVKIGDNVWIGMRCSILKGTFIPPSTVVAANTVLSGNKLHQYDGHILVAGNPGKVIREGIDWPP